MRYRALFLFLAASLASAASLHASRVTITWQDNSTNEQGFRIERALGTGAFTHLATVGANTTSYTDSNLLAGILFRYRVCAYNAAGDSAYSNFVTYENSVRGGVLELSPIDDQILSSSESAHSVPLHLVSGSSPTVIVASSSNPELIPHPAVTGARGTMPPSLELNPERGRAGTAIITVTVSDGNRVSYRRFTVTVARGRSGDAPGHAAVNKPRPGSRITNVSARAVAGAGSQTLLMGFNVADAQSDMMLRVAGPALSSFVGTIPVTDPVLTLFRGQQVLDQNQAWENAPGVPAAIAKVGAFPFQRGSRDAAVLKTLAPGSYTAEVRGLSTQGVALAELYHTDWDSAATGRLTNVSCRSSIDDSAGGLIIGFTVHGSSSLPLLLRGVGSTLSDLGVADVVARPKLTIRRGDTEILIVERWEPTPELIEASFAVGAFPLTHLSEAATIVSLPPGSYTVQVSASGRDLGEVLAELYELP